MWGLGFRPLRFRGLGFESARFKGEQCGCCILSAHKISALEFSGARNMRESSQGRGHLSLFGLQKHYWGFPLEFCRDGLAS